MATKWKCVGECEREFGVGDWECVAGVPHEVERKEYYLADAPTDGSASTQDMRNSRTTVHNIPPEQKMNDATTGEARIIPGGYVTFHKGFYATTSALEQYYLDRLKLNCGRERWMRAYTSDAERAELKLVEARNKESEANRKLQEANELLASVQEKVRVAKAGKPDMVGAGAK